MLGEDLDKCAKGIIRQFNQSNEVVFIKTQGFDFIESSGAWESVIRNLLGVDNPSVLCAIMYVTPRGLDLDWSQTERANDGHWITVFALLRLQKIIILDPWIDDTAYSHGYATAINKMLLIVKIFSNLKGNEFNLRDWFYYVQRSHPRQPVGSVECGPFCLAYIKSILQCRVDFERTGQQQFEHIFEIFHQVEPRKFFQQFVSSIDFTNLDDDENEQQIREYIQLNQNRMEELRKDKIRILAYEFAETSQFIYENFSFNA